MNSFNEQAFLTYCSQAIYLLPQYYGFSLAATVFHEVGHATAATILGFKVTKIRVTPWATGFCHYKGIGPSLLRTRAMISIAGPTAGLATVATCLVGYSRINNNNHSNKLTNILTNSIFGLLVADELINLIPRKGYDGYDCWWYLKTQVYKNIDPNLLKPKCGFLKSHILASVIAYTCISFFNEDLRPKALFRMTKGMGNPD